jgi:cytochrome c oxidase subunit 2
MKYIYSSLLSVFCLVIANVAQAENVAKPLQLGFKEPASPQMERIASFHDDLLMWIITGIVIFVTALLVYVCVKFRAKANPTPSKTTHNVVLEILWTAIPVIILIIIAIPSFKMLYYLDRVEEPDMTLKVTGYQWYWGYEYPDHDGINFLSYMIPDDEIDPDKGQHRLLSTDNPVVLPIDTNIQIIVTAADVLHSFTIPAFGIKKDAVTGRLNETWVRIDEPGTYYGQCSEICGINHAYMPIEIKAVTKEEFEQWVEKAKEEFTFNYNDNLKFASVEGVL